MKRPLSILLLPMILLGLFSACSNTPANESQASTNLTLSYVVPTDTPIPPTPSPLPTLTNTQTPEPGMKAGIPEKIEQCNRMQIYNTAGVLDPTLIDAQMRELVASEKEYIKDKRLGAKDVSRFITAYTITEPSRLPYSYARGEGHLVPVSCSLVFTGDGSWRLMIGVIFKQDFQATTISVAHFLLDHPGLEKYATADGEQEYYQTRNSPEATFEALRSGPPWFFEVRIWIPGESTNPEFFPDWIVSHDLVELNQEAPIYLNMYLTGVKFDPTIEGGFVPIIEKMILPAMRVQVSIII
jgi:hypothetical protein